MTFPENFIPESALICLLVRKFASFQEQGKKLFMLSHVSTGGIQEKRKNVYIFDKLNQLKRVRMKTWKKDLKSMFPEIVDDTFKQPVEGDWDLKFNYKKISILKNKILVNRWPDSGKKKFLFQVKGDRLSAQHYFGDIRDALGQVIFWGKHKITQGLNYCLAFPLYEQGYDQKWKKTIWKYLKSNALYDEICDIFKRKGSKIFNLRYFFVGKNDIEIYDRYLNPSNFFSSY